MLGLLLLLFGSLEEVPNVVELVLALTINYHPREGAGTRTDLMKLSSSVELAAMGGVGLALGSVGLELPRVASQEPKKVVPRVAMASCVCVVSWGLGLGGGGDIWGGGYVV